MATKYHCEGRKMCSSNTAEEEEEDVVAVEEETVRM